MSLQKSLNFDKDICPMLSLAASIADKEGCEPVPCRADCAWFDMEDGRCAIMGINVHLKALQDLSDNV